MTGWAPRPVSCASQERRTASVSSRRLIAHGPAQGDGLVRAEVVAGQHDHDVVAVVVPHQILSRRVLGSVDMFFDRSADGELTAAAVTKLDGQVPGEAHHLMSPIVILKEPHAFAGAADNADLARPDGR